ncbi:hypothetical protein QAD02_010450 [Eretmocerus hayati]|uniref:Uncharacterized protein n=1 Tax=Eretmocerus hayati TaxID=131215 RepID=A0ACC2NTW8_9HYME|nr:hypothetical protein QAD02_010450 [Eretmocerus hayati]
MSYVVLQTGLEGKIKKRKEHNTAIQFYRHGDSPSRLGKCPSSDPAIPAWLFVLAEARRVQLRARVSEPAQLYYAEEEDDASQLTDPDDYPGGAQVAYQPRTRALPSPRSKDSLSGAANKPPPVQTIRNYNKVNDDGSFTFGYEAADGSFKEETRGTDCVVRGKYGYVDPDGNKREFTYVSGNPCDPNAPKDEDDDELLSSKKQQQEDAPGPANYPSVRPRPTSRPNYPSHHVQSTTARPPTTIFQTEYQLDDDASQELEEDSPRSAPTPAPQQLRPSTFRRPQYVSVSVDPSSSSPLYSPAPTSSPTLFRLSPSTASPTTPSSARFTSVTTPASALRSSPAASYSYQPETSTRPASLRSRQPPQSVAITPRPHVAQVAAQYVSPGQVAGSTERPGVVFAPRTHTPLHSSTTSSPPSQHLDFAAELERYVNSVGSSPTPRPQLQPTAKFVKPAPAAPTSAPGRGDPIYQSELVYDPATGQYNTQLYQTLPQTIGDFSLSHKLQPFVAPQQQPLVGLSQSPIYRSAASAPQPAQQPAPAQRAPQPQQAVFQSQQARQLQQSQALYNQQRERQQQQFQQQRARLQQDPRLVLQAGPADSERQQFYYFAASPSSPRAVAASPLSAGQIDQFLRQGVPNY